MTSLNAFCKNQAFASSLQIISFSRPLACDGMKGLSSVAGWLLLDPSFQVPVGIVSGQSKMLPILLCRWKNNW